MRKNFIYIIWIGYKSNLTSTGYSKAIKFGEINKNVSKSSQLCKGKIKNERMIMYVTQDNSKNTNKT